MSKGFWKWFLIVLGALVVLAIAFGVTLFFLHGNTRYSAYNNDFGMMDRMSRYEYLPGTMLLGFGLSLLFRGLFTLGVLVLAGFGVAYLVNHNKRPAMPAPGMVVCKSCGKPLAPDWRACPHCGTAVQAEVTEPKAATTKKSAAKKA